MCDRDFVYVRVRVCVPVRGTSRNIPIAMDLVNFSFAQFCTILAVCKHVVCLPWDHGSVPITALSDLIVWADFHHSCAIWPVSAKHCCVQADFGEFLQMFGLRVVFCLVFCGVCFWNKPVQMERRLIHELLVAA